MIGRSFRVVSLAAGIMAIWSLSTAVLAATSLAQYLERASEAEYTAEQVVNCSTPDGTRDSVVQISHAGGYLVAWSTLEEGSSVEAGAGSVSMGDGSKVVLGLGDRIDPDDHYTVESVQRGRAAGRIVDEVQVEDTAGVIRAKLSFDVSSGALLATSIFNEDGSVWCEMHLVGITIGATADLPPSATTGGEDSSLNSVEAPEDPRLPDSIGGIERRDVYEWDGNGTVGYYSDGLLSFTVLASPGAIGLSGPGVNSVSTGGGEYQRWFGPGNVAFSWESSAGGIAVFGDIPLDVQATVLEQLPPPHSRGVLRQLWDRVFE